MVRESRVLDLLDRALGHTTEKINDGAPALRVAWHGRARDAYFGNVECVRRLFDLPRMSSLNLR
jgi:hypothetical protein